MIVRDEADTIGGCLDSCRELIDTWVICDTGSIDATRELIAQRLAGVPGELHEREWVDFAHNRSELMALAQDRADHLLLLDADWTIEAEAGALDCLTADAYMVRHAGPVEFHNKRLVSGRIPWRYVVATHEYIVSEEERSCERLHGLEIHVRSTGGERKGRWERDAQLLEQELERSPDDPRATFYLAQTYRDMARQSGSRELLERAMHLYARRTALNGWIEETYCAWHQTGVLSAELGAWPAAVEALTCAWELRPERLEATYELIVGLRTRSRYRTAHRLASIAASLQSLTVPEDNLFVSPWIYRWGLLFEYSIACYWVGDLDASIAACERLLELDELPDTHRAQTERNRRHAIDAKARAIAERAAALPA